MIILGKGRVIVLGKVVISVLNLIKVLVEHTQVEILLRSCKNLVKIKILIRSCLTVKISKDLSKNLVRRS